MSCQQGAQVSGQRLQPQQCPVNRGRVLSDTLITLLTLQLCVFRDRLASLTQAGIVGMQLVEQLEGFWEVGWSCRGVPWCSEGLEIRLGTRGRTQLYFSQKHTQCNLKVPLRFVECLKCLFSGSATDVYELINHNLLSKVAFVHSQ